MEQGGKMKRIESKSKVETFPRVRNKIFYFDERKVSYFYTTSCLNNGWTFRSKSFNRTLLMPVYTNCGALT